MPAHIFPSLPFLINYWVRLWIWSPSGVIGGRGSLRRAATRRGQRAPPSVRGRCSDNNCWDIQWGLCCCSFP
uniref:Uncharacterized protein n=1 Tax=Setaria viridis TaxID=4556 RepID=A0A4U6TQ67_SETVI|nr:hypothetical protein SEVIR_8G262200v2 [Setaria viridis]